jgi:hypothetical protein
MSIEDINKIGQLTCFTKRKLKEEKKKDKAK